MCTYTLRVLEPIVSFSSYLQFSNGTVIFKIPGTVVKPRIEYEVFFEISNAAGSINTSTTTFSKHDYLFAQLITLFLTEIAACQDVTAYIDGEKLIVTGSLRAGSSTQGCFFYLSGEEDHCVAVQQEDERVYHQTNYTDFKRMSVYDIEEDSVPDSDPALTVALDDSQSNGMT